MSATDINTTTIGTAMGRFRGVWDRQDIECLTRNFAAICERLPIRPNDTPVAFDATTSHSRIGIGSAGCLPVYWIDMADVEAVLWEMSREAGLAVGRRI